MALIIVYAAQSSPRLSFVLDWLIKEQLQLDYSIVHDESQLPVDGVFISYGKHFKNALSVPDAGLLWQQGITQQDVSFGSWYDIPTLFAIKDKSYTLPFDVFSAVFFLLSRYEEYYPFTPDMHGRYPAKESILYKNGWLRRPIVDEWIQALREMLAGQYQQQVPQAHFTFQPSYDIDIAYSYSCKGWQRNIGGYFKDALRGRIFDLVARTEVLFLHKKDPYDSFSWLRELHREYDWRPVFFVLAALEPTPFDKNIPPYQPQMKILIRQLAGDGIVGVHPSYFSTTHEVIVKEKRLLEKIIKKDVHFSRQHYIRFTIPDTYYFLMKMGILDECSMGYGTHLGFRAGTGLSFPWYDLSKEEMPGLRIHPFCFMDTSAHYEEDLDVHEAFVALAEMTSRLKKANSRLVTIFHNFSLGHDHEWKGWSDAYRHFLKGL